MRESIITNEEFFELLKQIAKDIESRRRIEKCYYDEDYYFQNGWNSCIDEVCDYLGSGAQMIRTE